MHAEKDRHPNNSDEHMGAVEGDRSTDNPEQGNQKAPGLDDEGLPEDHVKIGQDVIGANVDGTVG
jgi:hypothetical protein